MATYYSSFFSSGLLAESHDVSDTRPITPETLSQAPSTPRSMNIDLDGDNELTPTAPSSSQSSIPLPSISEIPATPAQDKPRLRRRRSSTTMGASSPMTAIKGRTNLASSASLQRHSFLTSSTVSALSSGTRSRSGSVNEKHLSSNPVSGERIAGRLRSGSVGGALRPRSRMLRKGPSVPPPNLPLPPPPMPSLCTSAPAHALTFPVPSSVPETPRRPLGQRSYTADSNLLIPMHTPPMSRSLSPLLTEDIHMESPGIIRADSPLALPKKLERDYPSPLDTPGDIRAFYFASKEN
ncbi:hypothetical protein ABKN59_003621 [Abortiporus biennis]